jgi:hypothetical protein
MPHAIDPAQSRFRLLLPRPVWIFSYVIAILFSLSPSPSLTSLHSAEWFWGFPRAFLWVYQSSDYLGHNPLQGSHYWFRWNLFEDFLFWLAVLLCAAFLCAAISKRVWGRIRTGFIFLVCFCLPLALWVIYLNRFCSNYFSAF